MTTSKGALVLGMLALAACAGCTTVTRPVAGDTSPAGDAAASPAPVKRQAQTCADNGGWYDTVAGACITEGK